MLWAEERGHRGAEGGMQLSSMAQGGAPALPSPRGALSLRDRALTAGSPKQDTGPPFCT